MENAYQRSQNKELVTYIFSSISFFKKVYKSDYDFVIIFQSQHTIHAMKKNKSYFTQVQGITPNLRIFITEAMLISITIGFFIITIGLDPVILFKRQVEKKISSVGASWL